MSNRSDRVFPVTVVTAVLLVILPCAALLLLNYYPPPSTGYAEATRLTMLALLGILGVLGGFLLVGSLIARLRAIDPARSASPDYLEDRGFTVVVGAGILLVGLPCLALLALHYLPPISDLHRETIGLPVLAILGILALFGALSLVSSLFSRLQMSDPQQALGLPAGSIRAAIALSLIVLFAIIAIMLFESTDEPGKPSSVNGISSEQMTALLNDAKERVVSAGPAGCPNGASARPECFDVLVLPPPNADARDLGKQLLTLIGTLMTSVTSFYFASRALEEKSKATEVDSSSVQAEEESDDGSDLPDDSEDGCVVAGGEPTPDAQLPAARGGVA